MSGDGFSYSNHGKAFGFGFQAMKRHPAIAPIVVIIGGVVVGVTAWCSYAMTTKMDVQVLRNKKADWETLDLTKPQPKKLFIVRKESYRAMPQLDSLLKEINEADK